MSDRMNARLLLAGMMIMALGTGSEAAGTNSVARPTVTVQGLRLVKPAPGDNDRMRAFNWSRGTTVSLLFTLPSGGLIATDRDASRITVFSDDKGKDLTKPDGESKFGRDEASFEMSPNITADGKFCLTEVDAPAVPTPGATSLILNGRLVCVVATQKKEFKSENVALKPDTKITAGSMPLTITKIGKPDWGGEDAVFSVTFETNQKIDAIESIKFLDGAGKEIGSSRSSTQTMNMMDHVTVTTTYNLKAKAETATIVISQWMDLKKVAIPFRLHIGVGM